MTNASEEIDVCIYCTSDVSISDKVFLTTLFSVNNFVFSPSSFPLNCKICFELINWFSKKSITYNKIKPIKIYIYILENIIKKLDFKLEKLYFDILIFCLFVSVGI